MEEIMNVVEETVENTQLAEVVDEVKDSTDVLEIALKVGFGAILVAGTIFGYEKVARPMGIKGIKKWKEVIAKSRLKRAKDVTGTTNNGVDVPADVDKTNPIE